MSELTDLLSNKRSGNADAIETIKGRQPETQRNVGLFSGISLSVDSRIVAIAASIVTLQNEIVTLSNSAFAVGCGTTGGVTTVYPDSVKNYSYNICTPSYDGNSPYDVTVSTLSVSNAGIGTLLIYTQNDSSQSGIGSLYGTINTCFRPLSGCNSGICVAFASSITTKQTEITNLRTQLTDLVSTSNKIRGERVDYEIQRYGENYGIRILGEENTRISLAITAIQNYS
jgi:hypothetical protein